MDSVPSLPPISQTPLNQINVTFKPRYQQQLRKVVELSELASEQFSQQKPIDRWLSGYFRKHPQFGSKDRKLISNTIFGYYRWYGWLKRLPKEATLKSLLLGYLLDGNPVSEMVEYWASECKIELEALKGFGQLPLEQTIQKLKLCSSDLSDILPEHLNPHEAGNLTPELINAFQKRPKLWIRLVEGQSRSFLEALTEKKIPFQLHPKSPQSLALSSNINLFEYEAFRKGNLEIQDIASQGIGLICNPQKGEIWWDACAGSGGKALQLAALMKSQGEIYATEVYQPRLNEMRKRIKRNSKWSMIKPVLWDGKTIPSFDKVPDHILVDAPCSCSGTWRRSPDLRWHHQKQKVKTYRQDQLNILNLVQDALPVGGNLVYATCSLFEEENQGVVEEFLKTHSSFSLMPLNCPFTGSTFKTGVSFNPPEVDGNSMYVAVMKKHR